MKMMPLEKRESICLPALRWHESSRTQALSPRQSPQMIFFRVRGHQVGNWERACDPRKYALKRIAGRI